jgi:hypothetical protein
MRFTDREVLTALDSLEEAIWQALPENPRTKPEPPL